MTFWGLVPARGGSKSIPRKNLVPLNGRPLLDYGVLAAKAWGGSERIFCSTDDDGIVARAAELGIEVDRRPDELAGDDVPVAEVARDSLRRIFLNEGKLADWLFLIQPTSPFVLPEHFIGIVEAIRKDPTANSVQTVTTVPHNHHAWNQRVLQSGKVSFLHAAERAKAHNKQCKPPLFVFGNLLAVRIDALMSGADFFALPSIAMIIQRPYDLDVDGPDDLAVADALLASGKLVLRHMQREEKK